ncbi:hypothetical protein J5N97_022460 [Dioscorea zingiberensis]|uniref:Uncharacterized protein n=1 Tax=Dioscorea zingiberensis TaxID=325984 RepID=A0A9D5CAF2_9LILI|nr:hypothetical protein J5N97_022460 [Dioscorea zingiberensis]
MPEATICDAALLLMHQILNWSFKQDSSVSDPSGNKTYDFSYGIRHDTFLLKIFDSSLIQDSGFLLILMAVPLNNNSKLGQAFARYVGKYVPGYFPITLHIEDAKAFDPNKAFVFAVEPHSVFPLGSLSLLSITGLMPLTKTRGLVSSARSDFIITSLSTEAVAASANLFNVIVESYLNAAAKSAFDDDNESEHFHASISANLFFIRVLASRKGNDSGVVYKKDSKLKEHRVFTVEELHLEPLTEEIIENSFPC